MRRGQMETSWTSSSSATCLARITLKQCIVLLNPLSYLLFPDLLHSFYCLLWWTTKFVRRKRNIFFPKECVVIVPVFISIHTIVGESVISYTRDKGQILHSVYWCPPTPFSCEDSQYLHCFAILFISLPLVEIVQSHSLCFICSFVFLIKLR